jgi:hypothetical protein
MHMTIKKSLLAAATAATVTVAGTGIAAAQDAETPETAPTEETSSSAELLGSMEGSTETLNVFNDFGGAIADFISILPNINNAVNDFNDMVADISGKFPALPF